MAAFSVADENRVGIVSSIVARHTKRQPFLGSLMRFTRTRSAFFIRGDFLLKSFVHETLRNMLRVHRPPGTRVDATPRLFPRFASTQQSESSARSGRPRSA